MSETTRDLECGRKIGTADNNGGDRVNIEDTWEPDNPLYDFKDSKTGLNLYENRLTTLKESVNKVILREERIVPVDISTDLPDVRFEIRGTIAKLFLYTSTDPAKSGKAIFVQEAIDRTNKLIRKKELPGKFTYNEIAARQDLFRNDSGESDFECSYQKVYRCSPEAIKSLTSGTISVNESLCLENFAEWEVTINLYEEEEDEDSYSRKSDDDDDDDSNDVSNDGSDINISEKQCKKRLPQIKESVDSPKRAKL